METFKLVQQFINHPNECTFNVLQINLLLRGVHLKHVNFEYLECIIANHKAHNIAISNWSDNLECSKITAVASCLKLPGQFIHHCSTIIIVPYFGSQDRVVWKSRE